jgi:hypothetical protein
VALNARVVRVALVVVRVTLVARNPQKAPAREL